MMLEVAILSVKRVQKKILKYAVDNKIETKINGQVLNALETSDQITLWTKAGIGEVKVVTVNLKSERSSSEPTRIEK